MQSVIRGTGVGWIRHAAAAALAVLLCLVPVSGATDFTKYHTYDELTAALKAAVSAHPELAKMTAIGKTGQGRSLWAIEIASPSGVPVAERPGLLIAANLEGDHLIGSELALYLVEYLLNGYATDPAIKQRLDNARLLHRAPRESGRRRADVRAGQDRLADEPHAVRLGQRRPRSTRIGPEDLNKDGFITVMRVKDPKGPYMIDPADSRLMKRADPAKGEQGGYAIYWEGLDKDNDGFIAEDGPGGVDINRNFMHQYPYFQPDAGRYMVSEAETRAMLDYVLGHRNIAAMLTFGESDNLIARRAAAAISRRPVRWRLIEFADRSIADARRVGMFQDAPAGFGGRGGGGVRDDRGGDIEAIMMGGRGGAAATQTAGGRGRRRPSRVDDHQHGRHRVLPDRQRAVPADDRPPGRAARADAGRGASSSTATTSTACRRSRRRAGACSRARRRPRQCPESDDAGDTRGGPFVPQGGQRGGAAGQGRGRCRRGRAGAGNRIAAGMPQMGGADAAGPAYADLRLLRWMDAEKIDGFVDLDAVQAPDARRRRDRRLQAVRAVNPPADRIAELGAGHAKFAMYLSSLFPQVKIAKTEVTAHGGGHLPHQGRGREHRATCRRPLRRARSRAPSSRRWCSSASIRRTSSRATRRRTSSRRSPARAASRATSGS